MNIVHCSQRRTNVYSDNETIKIQLLALKILVDLEKYIFTSDHLVFIKIKNIIYTQFILPPPLLLLPLPPLQYQQERLQQPHPHHQETLVLQLSCQVSHQTTWEAWLKSE